MELGSQLLSNFSGATQLRPECRTHGDALYRLRHTGRVTEDLNQRLGRQCDGLGSSQVTTGSINPGLESHQLLGGSLTLFRKRLVLGHQDAVILLGLSALRLNEADFRDQ